MDNRSVELYCKQCGRSLHMSYYYMGKADTVILEGVSIQCQRCKAVKRFKRYTEGHLAKLEKNGKIYI